MITDQETNLLYLADTLEEHYPSFHQQFRDLLDKHQVPVQIIPHTRDIWCRDYMPVQVQTDKLVAFVYDPDYLKPEEYAASRSDNRQICEAMGLQPQWSEVVLDGGNVIRWKNKAILTNKIYKENPQYERKQLRRLLQEQLQADELIVIPRLPYDITGHADGMVRFLDEHTVLVSDFSEESDTFQERLYRKLRKHRLEVEILPNGYDYYGRRPATESARGIYINYLHVGNLIVLPEYWMLKDEETYQRMRQLYPRANIETINCNGISEQGGVLNCVTWTIQRP